jgi:DNA-binding LytR/AlgR family response regulator
MQVDFFIHTSEGMIRFNNHEIFYFQSNGTGCKVVTTKGEFPIRTAIGKLDLEYLPSEAFCRVDKSFIVSLENVRVFKLDEVVINGTSIPVAKAYRARLFSSVRMIW